MDKKLEETALQPEGNTKALEENPKEPNYTPQRMLTEDTTKRATKMPEKNPNTARMEEH